MNKAVIGFAVGLVVLLVLGSQSIFYVNEFQRGLVLRLGEPTLPIREPGLNFKMPFLQQVVILDNRIQLFSIAKTKSLTSDMKPLELDNYACWKIVDPLLFVQTMRSEAVATERLRNIVYSQLRAAVGSKELNEVVNTGRTDIMEEVLLKSQAQAAKYGVKIIDVRIKRTDLPTREAIFNRMNAERKKMANKYRYDGESEKRRIESEAEMERDIILAEAERKSILIRGEADAKAMQIFREAITQSPEFYEFTKSLDVYRKALIENTKMILSKDDPLLKFLQQ